jgi:hypothetical protein
MEGAGPGRIERLEMRCWPPVMGAGVLAAGDKYSGW